MDGPRTCPFCGGRASRRRPPLGGAELGASAAGVGLSLRAAGAGGWYLHCDGCTADFVRADRDVGTIVAGLRVDPRAALQVRHYHGEGVRVSDLLLRHLAAMARRVNARRSLASVSVDRGELLACFSHRGVRTYGSLVRRRDGGGYDHYVLRGLGKA